MERLDFIEIAKLINKSGITEINLDPIKKEIGRWTLYSGINKSPIKAYPLYILYIHSDSTKEAINDAIKKIDKPSETLIVYAPSLPKHFFEENRKIKKEFAGALNTREFLLSYVKDKLSVYLERVKNLYPIDYVDPGTELPGGIKTKVPNRPLYFLTVETDPSGLVGILLGEPGQGKTHMSKWLAYRVSEFNFIPIYINSAQWNSMHSENLSSLSKTITHSFRYFETPIGWIEGSEDEFLRVSLKAGLFRIIFDGFDEYILWNRGELVALEILKSISDLASITGSKIMITSRTSFWNSEITDQSLDYDKLNSYIYKIEPFDRNKALNYFKLKLDAVEPKIGKAISIFDKLRERSSHKDQVNLVGRGFILNAIADLAKNYEGDFTIEKNVQNISSWLMESFCDREIERQKLPIDTPTQLDIFKEFAEETAIGAVPNSELLRFIISCYSNLSEKQLDELVGSPGKVQRGKLADHPIIRRKAEGHDQWEFVQEQYKYNLLAECLIQHATSLDPLHKKLRTLLDRIKLYSNLYTEITSCIVDQIFGTYNYNEAKNVIKNVIKALLGTPLPYSIELISPERKLAASIALLTVSKFSSTDKDARVRELISYFPNESLSGIHFWGTISNMNFKNLVFKECCFDQVIWKNCEFNELTIFMNCTFYGGRQFNCKDLGIATWEGGWTDPDATSFINSAKIKSGKRKYGRDDLRNDIEHLINKFMPKEGIFKSLVEVNLTKGPISNSYYREEVIKGFSKYILEKHHVSGTTDTGFKVKDIVKIDLIGYLSNKYFTGMLRDCYDFLCKKLNL